MNPNLNFAQVCRWKRICWRLMRVVGQHCGVDIVALSTGVKF
jgi:hypothetical protein